jgi:hypothetical protein
MTKAAGDRGSIVPKSDVERSPSTYQLDEQLRIKLNLDYF